MKRVWFSSSLLQDRVDKSQRLGLKQGIIFEETDQLVEDFIQTREKATLGQGDLGSLLQYRVGALFRAALVAQQNSAELALVQVEGSRVPAAHPHPEIPKVTPPPPPWGITTKQSPTCACRNEKTLGGYISIAERFQYHNYLQLYILLLKTESLDNAILEL